jgi:hypothetical protein
MQQDHRQDRSQQDGWRERRGNKRLDTTVEASVSFLVRVLELHGQLEDLSLSGARFAAPAPCPHGAGHLVEVSFRLYDRLFRITAVVQWNDGSRLGLCFEPLGDRRRRELEEAIILESVLRGAEPEPDSNEVSWTETSRAAAEPAPEPQPPAAPVVPKLLKERRTHRRIGVEMPAAIYLINSNIKLNGKVENLSLGGCCIRTDQRLHAGTYTRIEAGFYHMGMPFRVAGVLQASQGPNLVGIRFLDVTERIGAKLADLIKELEGEKSEGEQGPGA